MKSEIELRRAPRPWLDGGGVLFAGAWVVAGGGGALGAWGGGGAAGAEMKPKCVILILNDGHDLIDIVHKGKI